MPEKHLEHINAEKRQSEPARVSTPVLPNCPHSLSTAIPEPPGEQTSVDKSCDKSHTLEGDSGILCTGAFQV